MAMGHILMIKVLQRMSILSNLA